MRPLKVVSNIDHTILDLLLFNFGQNMRFQKHEAADMMLIGCIGICSWLIILGNYA